MLSYYKYLYSSISANLILYYLVIISASIINTSIILTILISLFRYLFTNSFAFDLFDRSTKIAPFFKYNIFIVFTDLGTPSRRLIFIFNSNIRSFFGILSVFPCLVNMNRFDISTFFVSFFSIVFSFFWTVTH